MSDAATMSVVAAVERDLLEIAAVDGRLAESALAATALVLAAELDSGSSSTSKSMCANALRDVLAALRERMPEVPAADSVSALADRTRLKLAGRP